MSTEPALAPARQTEAAARRATRALSRLRFLEVGSSAIAQVAYDGTATTLYAQVRGNAARLYVYRGLSSETFMAFIAAPSAGSYFARHIRNQYPTDRIEFAVSQVAMRAVSNTSPLTR